MEIKDIRNRPLRKLAELRSSQSDGIDDGSNILDSFHWDKTPEGYSFWCDVSNGEVTALPSSKYKNIIWYIKRCLSLIFVVTTLILLSVISPLIWITTGQKPSDLLHEYIDSVEDWLLDN